MSIIVPPKSKLTPPQMSDKSELRTWYNKIGGDGSREEIFSVEGGLDTERYFVDLKTNEIKIYDKSI